MVFRKPPIRRSTYLSPETQSAARAESASEFVDLLHRLSGVSRCENCEVLGNKIVFRGAGRFVLDLWRFAVYKVSHFEFGLRPSPESTPGVYSYYIANADGYYLRGRLNTNPGMPSVTRTIEVPVVHAKDLAFVIESGGPAVLVVNFAFMRFPKHVRNHSIAVPMPDTTTAFGRLGFGSVWLMPAYHSSMFEVWYASSDGNPATVRVLELDMGETYRSGWVWTELIQISTSSTSPQRFTVYRLHRDAYIRAEPATENVVIYAFIYRFSPTRWVFSPTKSVTATYSTTSASYARYTPLSLTTLRAAIRRIIVSASTNANWYVAIDGNRVLDKAWGVADITFSPPTDPARTVDLYLASTDGSEANATITIIYDELARI